MAIITKEEAKLLLQITDTSKDLTIELLIPIVEDFVKTYCGTDFTDAQGKEDFPIGIKLPTAQLIGFNLQKQNMQGVKSESLADHSISFDGTNGYPKSMLAGLDMYVAGSNKIRWD